MSKVLDLDAITPPQRLVRVKGKDYELVTLSVKQFIELTRKSEALQKRVKAKDDVSLTEIFEMQVDAVALAIPSMPRDVLETLSYDQIDAVLSHARETAEKEKPEAPKSGEGSPGNG